ncbi:Sec-independent protein translocase subunit TatA [Streptomyces sp. NPDC059917]|uniref:Sec-independent protein translocase subunit TatA n=1 Tax=Streptomyces sp. NPDC059917 TaxID=3347002 RepID=UPI003659EE5D
MLRNAMEPWHLVVLLVVCLLVFGSKKLPDMARSLGKSARILKSEAKAMRAEDQTPSTEVTPR